MTTTTPVLISDQDIALDDLLAVSKGQRKLQLSDDPTWRDKITRGRQALERAIDAGQLIYGVNTGFGRTSSRHLAEANAALQRNLIRMQGTGLGPLLSPEQARATMLARLVCLAKGYSGVRLELLEALTTLINTGVTPAIPSYGSVGASGDLVPLSYLGALMLGERDALLDGQQLPAHEALQQVGWQPFDFAPREGLAIINGTSFMSGIGALTIDHTAYLLRWATQATALALDVAEGRPEAMHPTIHKVKGHPGQQHAAAQILTALHQSPRHQAPAPQGGQTVQDRYSLRCAPHILGAAEDALSWIKQTLHQEINSVNDNPIIDPDTGEIHNGGNFYGGHIALAMDLLKITLGSVITLFERQFALLVSDTSSLPATLLPQSWQPDHEQGLHHGLKSLQITVSSLTALAHQRAHPDTLQSRPTEADNQDIVSMGANAALHAHDILQLGQLSLASWLIALSQAAAIRGDQALSPSNQQLAQQLRQHVPLVKTDRHLDKEIQQLTQTIQQQTLPFPS